MCVCLCVCMCVPNPGCYVFVHELLLNVVFIQVYGNSVCSTAWTNMSITFTVGLRGKERRENPIRLTTRETERRLGVSGNERELSHA